MDCYPVVIPLYLWELFVLLRSLATYCYLKLVAHATGNNKLTDLVTIFVATNSTEA